MKKIVFQNTENKCTVEGCNCWLHHKYETNVFGERIRVFLSKEFCKKHGILKQAQNAIDNLQSELDTAKKPEKSVETTEDRRESLEKTKQELISFLQKKKDNGTIDETELSMLTMLVEKG